MGLGDLKNAEVDMVLRSIDFDADGRQIFGSIDLDNSGTIDWAEFKHDFDKCVKKSLRELEEEERILH